MLYLKLFCKIYINVLKCFLVNFNFGLECLCGFIFILICVYFMINFNYIINLIFYMCIVFLNKYEKGIVIFERGFCLLGMEF